MLKLLFLLPEFPTAPRTGAQVKLFSLLSFVGQHHDCDIISFHSRGDQEIVTDGQAIAPKVRILHLCRPQQGVILQYQQARAFFLQRQTPAIARFYTKDFVEKVAREVAHTRYDAVHVDMIGLAPYIRLLPARRTVLSVNDAISLTYRRMVGNERGLGQAVFHQMMSRRVIAVERQWYPRYGALHVVSQVDAEYLRREAELTNVVVIPLGGPGKWFDEMATVREGWGDDGPALFAAGHFHRRFGWEPLVRFLDVNWDQIRMQYPNARLTLIGSKPAPELSRAASKAGVNLLQDVSDYARRLREADVVLLLEDAAGPSGMKARALEALAGGKALVASTAMVEGIGVTSGVECVVADTPAHAGESVLRLLESPKLRRAMGTQAQLFARQHFSPEAVGRKWEALYTNLATEQ